MYLTFSIVLLKLVLTRTYFTRVDTTLRTVVPIDVLLNVLKCEV